MKTPRKSITSYASGNKGTNIIELLIVLLIIGTLASISWTYIGRVKERTRVSSGLQRIHQLKKAVEQMSRECHGYPLREWGSGWANLRDIINRYGATNNPSPVGVTPATIVIYPVDSGRLCDGVSLQNIIPTGLQMSTCNISTAGCSSGANTNQAQNFNEVFVEDPAASAICPEPGGGGMITGWNYGLVTQGTLAAPTVATRAPVAVYCANVVYRNSSVTIIVNGGGFNASGKEVTDGSGMIDIKGKPLSNPCPCAAWCGNNLTGDKGCCKNCVDAQDANKPYYCKDTDSCYNY